MAAARIAYAEGRHRFGELRLPAGRGPFPVAIVIHGGCWLADNGLDYMGTSAIALTRQGLATWSIEYRRVGNVGGGWPGTFEDVALGADHLRDLSRHFPLDLERIVAIGHSAGGHLALWLASRHRLREEQPLFRSEPIRIRGVLALAPASDLAMLHRQRLCGDAIEKLMGGSPQDVPEHYRAASPLELLPIGVPQVLIVGGGDRVWARLARRYFDAAVGLGEDVQLLCVDPSEHFDIVDPTAPTWPYIREAAMQLSLRAGAAPRNAVFAHPVL